MSAGSTGKAAGTSSNNPVLGNTPTQDQTNQFSQGITPNTASGGQPNPLAQFAPGAGASATDLTAQNFNQGGSLTSNAPPQLQMASGGIATGPNPTGGQAGPNPPSWVPEGATLSADGQLWKGTDKNDQQYAYGVNFNPNQQSGQLQSGPQPAPTTGESALQSGVNGLNSMSPQSLFDQYSQVLARTPDSAYGAGSDQATIAPYRNPGLGRVMPPDSAGPPPPAGLPQQLFNQYASTIFGAPPGGTTLGPTQANAPAAAPVATPKPQLPAFAQPTMTGGQSIVPYTNKPPYSAPAPAMRPNQLPKLPATQAPVPAGYTGGGINRGPQATGLGSIGPTQRPTVPAFAKPTLYQPGQSSPLAGMNQRIGPAKPIPGKVNTAPMRR